VSTPWVFVEALPADGGAVELDDVEAQHLAGARRLRDGDPLIAFDGSGRTANGILRAGNRRDPLRVELERPTPHPPPPAIHLASAVPKGDRLATLLDMVTQLGIVSFRPLACRHGVAGFSAGKHDRFRRIVIEACKQSRRAHVPALLEESSPLDAVAWARGQGIAAAIAHPGGGIGPTTPCLVLIGPEGGFTDAEVAACVRAGAATFSLGDGILRIETAAVKAVARLG
jgi:16S rRNA (uracil1498-N3)-methyltransferase